MENKPFEEAIENIDKAINILEVILKYEALKKADKAMKATPEYKAREKAWEAYEEAKKTYDKAKFAKKNTTGTRVLPTSLVDNVGELQRKGIESWAESIAYAYSDREE